MLHSILLKVCLTLYTQLCHDLLLYLWYIFIGASSSCVPEELVHTPDLHLLCDMVRLLERSLVEAERSYMEFEEACNTAIDSCSQAADVCARKANEARDKKTVTRIAGGATSGAAFATAIGFGVFALATGGIGPVVVSAAVGTAGAVGAVTTHCLANKYEESEASFRSFRREFDCLMTFARDLKEGVAQAHTNLECVSAQVDNIAYCIRNGSSINLVQGALERLNEVCIESYGTTSRCNVNVKSKIQELKMSSVSK